MDSEREGAGMAVVDGVLYAVGGYDGRSYLSSVERYGAAADAWTAVASMGSKRSRVGVAVLDGEGGPLTLSELRAAGCSTSEVSAARGSSAAQLRSAGFTVQDIVAAGFATEDPSPE